MATIHKFVQKFSVPVALPIKKNVSGNQMGILKSLLVCFRDL